MNVGRWASVIPLLEQVELREDLPVRVGLDRGAGFGASPRAPLKNIPAAVTKPAPPRRR